MLKECSGADEAETLGPAGHWGRVSARDKRRRISSIAHRLLSFRLRRSVQLPVPQGSFRGGRDRGWGEESVDRLLS